MQRPFLISYLLATAFTSLAGAAPLKEATIFYFDTGFQINYNLVAGLEEAAKSTDAFKITAAATETTFTDGKRFIIDKPPGLTLDEVRATTDYARIGEVEIINGGKSFLTASAELPPGIGELIIKSMPGYFKVDKLRAGLVSGTTPKGRKFTAVDLDSGTPGISWSHTMNISYTISAAGKIIHVTEACLPMGMGGFSRRVREQSAIKDRNVLISLGLTSDLMSTVLKLPVNETIARLERFGTDIITPDAKDLRYLWAGSEKPDVPVSTGGVTFICSNIEIKDPGLARLIKPYAIRELNGMRIAFLSFIQANSGQLTGMPIEVKDPADRGFRDDLVEELRGKQNVRIVVAVAETEGELGKLLQTPGVDIVIGHKSWERPGARNQEIKFSNWDKEAHYAPGAVIFRDSRGLGEINLEFSDTGSLATLRNRSIPFSPEDTLYDSEYDDFKEKVIQHFFGSTEALLPDARKIGTDPSHPKSRYSQLDVHNLVVATLREKTGAEISLMKIQPFTSNIMGEIPASMVSNWLGEDDKVIRAWVPGSLLRMLMPKFEFSAPPGDNGYQRYVSGNYFAVSGLSPEGRISGLPVRSDEFYLAAFPAKLLKESDSYPQLKNIRIKDTGDKTLKPMVLDYLEELKAGSRSARVWEAAIGKLVENKPAKKAVWRLNVRDLSLRTSDMRVRNTENFSQVSDSKLRTTGQTYIQGSGSVFSEFYRGDLRFDTGLSADYGKITLRPKGQPRLETESVDQVVLESELRYRLLRYNGFMGSLLLGPFFNLAYDTEFTRQMDLPKRKIVRSRAGMKLFEGVYLRELYTGLVTEQDYTNDPARTKYAAEAGFGLNMPLPGTALTLEADGNYRNFAESRFDTAADLKQRLELNVKLSTKLYGDITISPFFNLFLATNKIEHGTARNIMTGISLNYSRLFKLKY